MSRCALIVEFRLTPGDWPRFHDIMADHAHRSRTEEPGCQQFDVLHAEDDADRVILVEVYADRAAYEAHRQTDRMERVNEALAPLTLERKRTICTLD